MPLLKLCWRKPVIKSVTALRIVKHLNEVGDALPGAIPSCISLVFDAFTLQELKKTFQRQHCHDSFQVGLMLGSSQRAVPAQVHGAGATDPVVARYLVQTPLRLASIQRCCH